MCDYTEVQYQCGHVRYIVKAWCVRYQETQQRCPPNIVAVETRLDEKCGDCKDRDAAAAAQAQKSGKAAPVAKKAGGRA